MPPRALGSSLWLGLVIPLFLCAEPQLVEQNKPRLWQRAEWRIDGAPSTANNFDPELVRIDASITTPTKRVLLIPAFWFQDYTRALVNGVQTLTPAGSPQWRLRFTPDEIGEYSVTLTILQPGAHASSTKVNFVITSDAETTSPGWVRTATDHRYFETSDGQALRLIGANVCWGGTRGTFDYDNWFPAMRDAGANFARLWFCPWSMGLEHTPGTLNRYDLAAAWHADYVLELAEKCGLYVLIAMDHHGMFMSNDPA